MWQMIIGFSIGKQILKTTIITCHIAPCGKEVVPKLLAAEKDRSVNVDHFLTLVRKYTDVQELTAEIVREFVEKVYVYQAERIDGQKVQRIRIVWNCIGEFTPPTVTNTEKSA